MISFTGITSGQFQIPVGVNNWQVIAFSGAGFLNGARLLANVAAEGGPYDIRHPLDTAINVGCTGGYLYAHWSA